MRKTDLRDAVIATARAQVGYRAIPGVGTSTFGSWAGHPQGRWDGAFLDWCAAENGAELHRMTDTNWAMREYIRTGRMYRKPRIGDIAFLHPDTQFGMPKVALVTEVSAYGNPNVLGGMAANPQVRANKDPIGVYEWHMNRWNAIGYGRPRYLVAGEPPEAADTEIRTSDIQWQKRNQKIQLVQLALSDTVGAESMARGVFDTVTREWYRQWQRQCGKVTPDGVPDDETLQKLGAVSGLFTWKE